ncbi:MAG: glycosyltransferase family 4 protein, partial [Actinomycetota bacterium]|nr:glycosyltransferase family 4 protein [Actinomycetota bacterium]
PLTFSLRANRELAKRFNDFDIVHDNQCLGYGILKIHRSGLPVLATIHHPITVDRRLETKHATTRWKRFTKNRFYSFTRMQTKVAQKLPRILTVSTNSFDDIVADHGISPDRLHIVHVGVDSSQFIPLPEVPVVPGRLMTTASADVAMKGLAFLLEALAKIRTENPDVHLVVIGKPKYDSKATALIKDLKLENHIEFISGVPDEKIVELYSTAELAIVPSLYEGFSLPAIEAMSCGVPLIATTGGALPEVVGDDGVTALHVPPGDVTALANKIRWALDQSSLRRTVGHQGRLRVISNYSWHSTAEKTVEHYYALLDSLEQTNSAGGTK